jgi:hypothetical protein
MKKQTAAALTDLDWAVQQAPKSKREPGEFTATDFFRAGGAPSDAAARSRLRRMRLDGQLTSRQVLEAGKWTTVFRRP